MKRTFAPEYLAHFKILDRCPLDGVTAELLADMHDITRKFGSEDPYDNSKRLINGDPIEIQITQSANNNNFSLVVLGPGGETVEGAYVFSIIGPGASLEIPGIVIWDKRVSVDSMHQWIEAIDKIMMNEGLIDVDTNDRMKMLEFSNDATSYNVEEIFAEPGAVVILPDDEAEQESIRQHFDEPEKLVFVKDEFDVKYMCHIRDFDYMRRRVRVAKAVLLARGINSIEQLSELSEDELSTIRKEIENKTQN